MFSTAFAARLAGAAIIAALAAGPPAAHAGLLGQSVGVTLSDPSGSVVPAFSFQDLVTVGGLREIEPLNGTNIGDAQIEGSFLLLANEYVDLQDSSVTIGLEAGGENGTTGYGPGSSWVLDFDPLVEILDVHLIGLNNVSGVDLGAEITFTAHSLRLLIDTLTIPQILDSCGFAACGSISIGFTVREVPEPATAALLGLGLGGLLLARRRLRRAVACSND